MKKGALLLGGCACFLIFALLCFPAEMLAASAEGVQLWLTKVFPSLFPFLVACGILLRIGAAQRMGAALRPLMQPLFHLPGIAAFPFFFGLLSGYPMGAKLTAQLYEQRQLSLADAQQLLAFSNCPGPLFLIGTVGVGFFGMPAFGVSALALRFSRRSRHRYSLSQEKIRSRLSFCFRSFLPNSDRGAFRFCCGCTSHHSANWRLSYFVCGGFRGNGTGRAIFSALPSAVFSAAFHGNTARLLQWYSGNDKRSASPKPLPRWSASAADAGRISRFLRRSFHSGTDLRRACRHAHIKKRLHQREAYQCPFQQPFFLFALSVFLSIRTKRSSCVFFAHRNLFYALFSLAFAKPVFPRGALLCNFPQRIRGIICPYAAPEYFPPEHPVSARSNHLS